MEMKKYRVYYFCHIIKDSRDKIVRAETKAKARKAFKESYYQPPTIVSVDLIEE